MDIAKNQQEKVLKTKRKAIKEKELGYCIRTGDKIPFNPERPYSLKAFREWNKHADLDFKENFCHRTGEKSNGKTSMVSPIL